jgi:hypothetical protein
MSDLEMWTEHAAFMDALFYDGFVVLGGPVANGARILLIIVSSELMDRYALAVVSSCSLSFSA